jgi:hypothetical protein
MFNAARCKAELLAAARVFDEEEAGSDEDQDPEEEA